MNKDQWRMFYSDNKAYEIPRHRSGTLLLAIVRREKKRRTVMQDRWRWLKRIFAEVANFIGGVLLFGAGILVILFGVPLIAALLGHF